MSERAATGLLALALVFGSAGAIAQGQSSWRWSGDYKNLLLGSKTLADERYTLDVNRLRLELKGSIGKALTVDLQYDNEVLLGDYLRTSQFQLQKDLPSPQYWSAQSNYVDRADLYGSHRLYRGSLNLSIGNTDLRVGRQRITWGTGRFWSPLDLLNPIDPITLDRAERLGVDALLVEHKLGALSRVAAVYAPDHVGRNSTRALLWHDNAGGFDYSVVAGRFRGDDVLGVDLAGQVGQAVVRGEWTRVRPLAGAGFNRSMLGIDYAFANTLTLSAEFYQDGSGATAREAYDLIALASGRRQTLARRYFGLHARYEFSPLVKWNSELVINLVDYSRYFAPAITWSLRDDLDWSFGLQSFSGSAGSEFSRYRNAAYTQLRWHF